MVVPPFSIRSGQGNQISFPGDDLKDARRLLVTSDDLEDGLRVIRQAFEIDGRIPLSPNRAIATYVSPNPRSELSRFTENVVEEIALGVDQSNSEVRENLMAQLSAQSIIELGNRVPTHLSGGESSKVVLAAHLAHQPSIVVVDQTLGELDVKSRSCFLRLFAKSELFDQTFLVILDYPDVYDPNYIDRVWAITNAAIIVGQPIRQDVSRIPEGMATVQVTVIPEEPLIKDSDGLFSVRNLGVMRSGRHVIDDLAFSCRASQLSWIVGKNGSGKTTLFEALTNLISSWEGEISYRIGGQSLECNGLFSYSPQSPDIDITEATLVDEIALAMDPRGLDKASHYKSTRWLDTHGIDWQTMSLDSNRSKKLASVLAAIARNTKVLLMDEPTLYLNNEEIGFVIRALKSYLVGGGIALISTHDRRLIVAARDQLWKL